MTWTTESEMNAHFARHHPNKRRYDCKRADTRVRSKKLLVFLFSKIEAARSASNKHSDLLPLQFSKRSGINSRILERFFSSDDCNWNNAWDSFTIFRRKTFVGEILY